MSTSHLKIRILIFSILFILFYFPFFLAFKEFKSWQLNPIEIFELYRISFLQAILSALATMICGLWGSLGIFWVTQNFSKRLSALFIFSILLPSLLPPLYIVVSAFNIWSNFPLDTIGIVILHLFSEVGFCSLIIYLLLQTKLNEFFELAVLSGSPIPFFLKIVSKLILRDLLFMFGFFFVYFLMSLSIPLMIGGSRYTSLELSMYLQIVHHHNWNLALNFFIIQWAIVVFAILVFQNPAEKFWRMNSLHQSSPLQTWTGAVPVLLPFLMLIGSLIYKLPHGVHALLQQIEILENIVFYSLGSLLIGFSVGGGIFAFLLLIGFFYQHRILRKFFLYFTIPSPVILGFYMSSTSSRPLLLAVFFFVILMVWLYLPSLIKLGLLQTVEHLDRQIEMAIFYGASSWKVFISIILPQVLPLCFLLSGLGALWSMGDFAFGKMIFSRDVNLAMWIQSLIEQYRWDIALVLSWLLILMSSIVFLFFWSLSYVSHQKLK